MSRNRLMLAMAALPLMTRMYEDNRLFQTHEERESVEPQVKFSNKSKTIFRDNRQLREFSIKGHKVMAYSKKDAITRLKHQKKI